MTAEGFGLPRCNPGCVAHWSSMQARCAMLSSAAYPFRSGFSAPQRKCKAFARCARESLFDGPKRNQKPPSPDAIRRDAAAAVPCASRSTGHIGTFTVPQPKLATLKHGLLFDPAALRCSARFTARFEIKSNRYSNSNSKSKSNCNCNRKGAQKRSRSSNNRSEQQRPWMPAFAGMTRSVFGCESARQGTSAETRHRA